MSEEFSGVYIYFSRSIVGFFQNSKYRNMGNVSWPTWYVNHTKKYFCRIWSILQNETSSLDYFFLSSHRYIICLFFINIHLDRITKREQKEAWYIMKIPTYVWNYMTKRQKRDKNISTYIVTFYHLGENCRNFIPPKDNNDKFSRFSPWW